MKKISVIIPCYNVDKYLERLFKSIEVQSIGMENLEIICLDDKSTDYTLNILMEWEKQHTEDVCVVALPENGRQGRARNIGLEYASCKWVSFLDADDWIEKDYFEILYSKTAETEYDVIACDLERDFSDKLTFFEDRISKLRGKVWDITSIEERKEFFHRQVLNYSSCCKLLRKDFLTENKIYHTEGLAYEDSYWGALLNLYAKNVCVIPLKLYHYFVNRKSTILSVEADYHLDLLTNQELLWQECIRRGFMDELKAEIEIEYVYSCALAFWKIIVFRYDKLSYSKYRLLCANVQEHIPEIMSNEYIKRQEITEFYILLVKSLLNPLSKEQFEIFAQQIKKIGL